MSARWIVAFACATVLPVFAPVAVAQPSSEPAQPSAGMPTPPPLPPDYQPPRDDGQPDKDYRPSKTCVSSLPSTERLDEKPWGQDRLRFNELSKFATGVGQTVAVIDTGVSQHDYLSGRLDGGGDYVAKGGDGLEDCDGHGTMVAGIIAADPGDDRIGFRGIAPAARIVSIRQTSADYEFKDPTTNESQGAGNLVTLAKAIVHAADTPGVTVINISIDNCRLVDGTVSPVEQNLQAALRYAVEQQDIVVVASAGNFPEGTCAEQNGPDPNNPTWLVFPPWFADHVLSVAAVDDNGDLAEFSIHGPWVSVAAPGTDIISLNPGDPTKLANRTIGDKGEQGPIQGTSFAAPYVAGLAALVRDRFGNLTAKQVMNRIKTTASHPAATGGHDDRIGYGMINPVAALTAFIPAEKGIAADTPVPSPYTMPAPEHRDWAPLQVALIGSGGGLGLLLLTLFVVHTVRRNRADS
jgi:membrane-anchored mycosin MYCP